jgi:HlyD family secretion protein
MNTGKKFFIIVAVFSLSACINKNNDSDASGVFETVDVTVSAKGNGEIVYFDVADGQVVETHTPLGLIDTVQLYLQKLQLQASIRAMNSRRVNIERQIAALRQQIESQRRESRRFENLVTQNVASQKQLDDINALILMLEKQLSAQTETLNNSNNSIDNEQEALVVRIAQIDDMIKNSVIKSPITGTILGKYAEAGELAVQGRALFKVANIENMYLRAYITASQLTAVKIGQQVKVYSDMGESDRKEYQGKITWIADKAEFTPKTIQTRDERANLVYAVKISVSNDGYIKRGMYGDVIF